MDKIIISVSEIERYSMLLQSVSPDTSVLPLLTLIRLSKVGEASVSSLIKDITPQKKIMAFCVRRSRH